MFCLEREREAINAIVAFLIAAAAAAVAAGGEEGPIWGTSFRPRGRRGRQLTQNKSTLLTRGEAFKSVTIIKEVTKIVDSFEAFLPPL